MDKNGIILYETADHSVKLNVNTDGETVWLNRAQLAELFERDVSVIGRHVIIPLKTAARKLLLCSLFFDIKFGASLRGPMFVLGTEFFTAFNYLLFITFFKNRI